MIVGIYKLRSGIKKNIEMRKHQNHQQLNCHEKTSLGPTELSLACILRAEIIGKGFLSAG
jgi:hypothetical protein